MEFELLNRLAAHVDIVNPNEMPTEKGDDAMVKRTTRALAKALHKEKREMRASDQSRFKKRGAF